MPRPCDTVALPIWWHFYTLAFGPCYAFYLGSFYKLMHVFCSVVLFNMVAFLRPGLVIRWLFRFAGIFALAFGPCYAFYLGSFYKLMQDIDTYLLIFLYLSLKLCTPIIFVFQFFSKNVIFSFHLIKYIHSSHGMLLPAGFLSR